MGRGFGGVQRGYLLNLRVKVPSAQIPVWRCSHIRQLTGVTLTAESPDVNVLKRGCEAPDQSSSRAHSTAGVRFARRLRGQTASAPCDGRSISTTIASVGQPERPAPRKRGYEPSLQRMRLAASLRRRGVSSDQAVTRSQAMPAARNRLLLRLYQYRVNYLLLLPAVAAVAIFAYRTYPWVLMSFQDFTFKRGLLGSDWVGLLHFEEMFSNPLFYRAVRNTR